MIRKRVWVSECHLRQPRGLRIRTSFGMDLYRVDFRCSIDTKRFSSVVKFLALLRAEPMISGISSNVSRMVCRFCSRCLVSFIAPGQPKLNLGRRQVGSIGELALKMRARPPRSGPNSSGKASSAGVTTLETRPIFLRHLVMKANPRSLVRVSLWAAASHACPSSSSTTSQEQLEGLKPSAGFSASH